MDAGQISIIPRHCSLRALVVEAFEELAPQALAAGVELSCEVAEGLPPAWADSHRITQVLMNLLSNALKFTPQGGRIAARAAVLPGNQLAVMIDDTGQGIRADHLAHVFDRYWQGPMTAKTGSGLGLAICRGIVERSGGRIWAESMEGIGTTFTFTLPVA
jgi:signal transduction histidine kinase